MLNTRKLFTELAIEDANMCQSNFINVYKSNKNKPGVSIDAITLWLFISNIIDLRSNFLVI